MREFPPPVRKLFLAFAFVIYLAAFGYAVWQGFVNPIRNFDMVGYAGSVVSLSTSDPQAIYDRTMEDVKKVVWPEYYRQITEGEISNNSTSFVQQLPFYRIKPLYIGTVWLVHQLGAGLTQATWMVSALSFIALGGILAWWRPEKVSRGVWLLSASALCLFGEWPMACLARYSTPDALSLVWLMLAFVIWFRRKHVAAYAAFSLLAILARPDALLNVLALTFYFAVFCREHRMKLAAALLVMLAAVLLYFGMQVASGSYGWQKLFYYGFVHRLANPATTEVHLTWDQYQGAVLWGLQHEIMNPRVLFFAGFSVVALVFHYMRPAGQREWLWLLLITWANFVARFALFPAWGDERYYYSYYLLLLLACLELVSPFVGAVWKDMQSYRARING